MVFNQPINQNQLLLEVEKRIDIVRGYQDSLF